MVESREEDKAEGRRLDDKERNRKIERLSRNKECWKIKIGILEDMVDCRYGRLKDMVDWKIWKIGRLMIYIYIYIHSLSVCLFVCLYPINIKTGEPFNIKSAKFLFYFVLQCIQREHVHN